MTEEVEAPAPGSGGGVDLMDPSECSAMSIRQVLCRMRDEMIEEIDRFVKKYGFGRGLF